MNNSINVNSSFVSLLEQVALLNTNSVEIISKFNQALNTDSSMINVNMLNPDGTTTIYQMPTIGYLKKQIDIANTNIKRLAGIDSSTFIMDGQAIKKVYTVDLNREPYPIGQVGPIAQFTQSSNWFFESLMNPMLSVKINLTGLLPQGVNKILSRRYVIKFEENQDGLTTAGATSQSSFISTFLNRTNITISELENWISNPTNIGVISNTYIPYMIDEQVFDLSLKELNYKGSFSVQQIENDSLNNKVWYHLNTLEYAATNQSLNNTTTKTLQSGDELIVSRQGSSTRYRIKAIDGISNSSQLPKIDVERVEGYDPIPVGTNVLEYYSSISQNSSVKISIGFNEYNVIFVKPVNDENDIMSSVWSTGTAFYSSDLVLDTDTNTNLVQFYYKYVSDFGAILKDFATQKLPTSIGITPNKPILNSEHFKVVQINQHLTDTTDSMDLKKIHAQKIAVKSKIDQTNIAIELKNRELYTKVYRSAAEKSKAQNELDSLVKTQESNTRMLSSLVNQISSTKTNVKETPKFRVRGFWEFPDPQTKVGYRPQEIIGFYVEYRYSNKTGKQPVIEGFKLNTTTGSFDGSINAETQTTVPFQSAGRPVAVSAPSTSTNPTATKSTQTAPKTAYFSQWIPLYTDIRKRAKDDTTGLWYWQIENVSDADTPNINQLDIPIQQNERVEIRIKSISEVGYPDSKMMSDFSDVLTIDFPDELNNVLDDNQFILKEATQEETLLQFESNLNAKGLDKHLQDQTEIGSTQVFHKLSTIVTQYKDDQGTAIMSDVYIQKLTDEIAQLKEIVKSPKGQLEVSILKNNVLLDVLKPSSSVIYNVECENYGQTSGGTRTYINQVYTITDYVLRFKNISAYNKLGLYSDKLYDSNYPENVFYKNPQNKAVFVDINENAYIQKDNQFIWFSDNTGTYTGSELYYSISAATIGIGTGNAYERVLNTDKRNLGASIIQGTGTTNYFDGTHKLKDIFRSGYTYSGGPSGSGFGNPQGAFTATIHPVVAYPTDIIDTGSELEKFLNPGEYFDIPLKIFFMYSYSTGKTYKQPNYNDGIDSLNKIVKIYLDIDGQSRAFQTTITFNLRKNLGNPAANSAVTVVNTE